MKKSTVFGITAIIIVGIAALAYYQFSKTTTDQINTAKETVTNDKIGLSFSYLTGEQGFALIEPARGDNEHLAAYVLIPAKEYDDFKASTEAREAPASISVLVYTIDAATSTNSASGTERLDRVTRLQNWAIDNDTLTSFTRAKATPDIVEIDGVKALHYQSDGLYQQDIYLVSYQNRAYMFTSQYDDPTNITNVAFAEFIESLSFD